MRGLLLIAVGMTLGTVACGGPLPQSKGQATVQSNLTSIQEQIFDQGCATSGCHSGDAPPAGLDLSSADASYRSLVEVEADNEVAHENAWVRVKPFEPEKSFLLRKLVQPGIGEGSPMPSTASVLNEPYIEAIETWIAEGAQR